MVQLHSELRTETEGVERFPPRRGAGKIYIIGLGLPPNFLEFQTIGRRESDWGIRRVRFEQEGSGN